MSSGESTPISTYPHVPAEGESPLGSAGVRYPPICRGKPGHLDWQSHQECTLWERGGSPKEAKVLLPEAKRMDAGQAQRRDTHYRTCASIC